MSRLLSRIMLAIFLMPAAALVFAVSSITIGETTRSRGSETVFFCAVLTMVFIVTYWAMLWRSAINWSAARRFKTMAALLGTLLVSAGVALFMNAITRSSEAGIIFGFWTWALLWLISTCIVWRETAEERGERLKSVSADGVVCPTCGYNLTGLSGTRCPECGSQFTVNELLAMQPARADREIA